MLKRIESGTLNEKNGCFIGLFVTSNFYDGYEYIPEDHSKKEITQILLPLRWDSRFGFPGGFMEPIDKTIIDTIIRETKEEINFNLSADRISLFASHEVKENLNSHFFVCEISPKERDEIISKANLAEHFNAEMAGVNFVHCITPNERRDDKGIGSLVRGGLFAGASREELELLLKHLSIEY